MFVVNRWLGLPIKKDMGLLGTRGCVRLYLFAEPGTWSFPEMYSRGLTLMRENIQLEIHSKFLSLSTKLINMW